MWAFSSNFLIFVLARFVGGLSKGNISLSMAIITDVSDAKNRGKAMALVGIAFSIGFIIGPMIGAMFAMMSDKSSSTWFWYPAMFAFMLSLADILFFSLLFVESLPKVCAELMESLRNIDLIGIFFFIGKTFKASC